ncbi:MAG: Rpn family recombination-promoting nuclease/putative transposase, partial [Bacteroidota bacterium]
MDGERKQQKNQPHDRFFRGLLMDIDLVRALLKSYMRAKIKALINWATLEFYSTALFGEGSKSLYADTAYRVKTYDGAWILIILNHETKPDDSLSIRKLEYKLALLKRAHKAKEKPSVIYFLTWQSGDKIPASYPKNIGDY